MTTLTHDIVDCRGFKIIASLPWDLEGSTLDSPWGFLICTPAEDQTRTYGTLGETKLEQVSGHCLGIPLDNTATQKNRLAHLALTCALSIIDSARLELGDTAVVAGRNPLAYSILTAAKRQGAKTACLVHKTNTQRDKVPPVEAVADAVFEFQDIAAFEKGLDAFAASALGKTVHIDAAGQPDLVYAMASRLKRFAILVLCRQDAKAALQLDIRRYVHIPSVEVCYWAMPEDLEGTLTMARYYRQAANLIQWQRVPRLLDGIIGIGPTKLYEAQRDRLDAR